VSTLVLQASLREEKKLRVENAKLKKEIEGLKQELIQAEIRNGGRKKVLSSYNIALVLIIFCTVLIVLDFYLSKCDTLAFLTNSGFVYVPCL